MRRGGEINLSLSEQRITDTHRHIVAGVKKKMDT